MRAAATLLCITQLFGLIATQREHKVHNIVLYPHKHSWCKTTQIKQVVAYPGCDSIEVENNVCVGGCFSYSIPRTIPSSPGEVMPYCDSCQPSTHSWKHVVLNCSSGEYEGQQLTKAVQIIENCTCTKCKDSSSVSDSKVLPDEQPVGLEEDLQLQENDKPQLMDIMDLTPHRRSNYTVNNITHSNDTFINQRTLVLLGELSDSEGEEVASDHDNVALQEILHHVEGDDHKINGVVLRDFVRRVEEQGHINVDVERLQHVLEQIENAENEQKHGHHRHQHLIMGPHNSLVLPKDAVQTPEMFLTPTLDVPSHLLKPAHEGSEISYHNNLIPAEHSDLEPGTL